MKSALTLALLWAALITAAGQSGAPKVTRVVLFGHDYISVDEWARANGGQARWITPKQEIKVTLPAGNLTFTVDSKNAVVRSTHVWLSNPVAFRNGTAYVGALDLSTALHPVLFPSRYPKSQPIRTVMLDPGHGGRDPGNKEGARLEKNYTLSFSRELGDLLSKAGFRVIFTRSGDSFVDLPVRPDLARRRNADVFLSLHYNSADGPGGTAVRGTEVYCMTPARASSTNAGRDQSGAGAYPGNRLDSKNMMLAYQIQKAITDKTGAEDRGVKRARFWVLRDAEMPAVLIETAFMTNTADNKRIYDPAQRRLVAQAIVDGLQAYRKAMERQ